MILYTCGDSFTFGDELKDPKDAWPYILGTMLNFNVHNFARNGASNDYIVKTTVEYLESNKPDIIILGWTTPDRIDIGGKTATVNHDAIIFKRWNDTWAKEKLQSQINLMEKYVLKEYNNFHCGTWIEDSYFEGMHNYIGRFVEWCYGLPKGPRGHPLEQGHQRIADEISKYI